MLKSGGANLRSLLNRPNRRSISSSSNTSGRAINWLPLQLTLFGLTAGVFTHYYALDSRAGMHKWLSMPLVRAFLDAEDSHTFTVFLAKRGWIPTDRVQDADCLRTRLCGMELSNPVGIGAGFDKHAEAIDGIYSMGFGMCEIGSVTPLPQPGNPKPRLFRLEADSAAINRYGFNSVGVDEVRARLVARLKARGGSNAHGGHSLGINLGKNKHSPADSNADYVRGIQSLGQFADYVVVNVSSPNTPGLRDLQKKEILKQLMTEVKEARDALNLERKPALFVKISPDLSSSELEDIASITVEVGLDGVIISNTTISRPVGLLSDPEIIKQTGGLSGAPLKPLGLETVKNFYRLTAGKIPIIGCGGISSGRDALDYIESGASAIQIYTAIAYQGPGIVREIKDFLVDACKEKGVDNICKLVGTASEVK